MKHNFKPLALAAAVAATVSPLAIAQSVDEGELDSSGPAALIPYYTVQEDWVTGVHIMNVSQYTQVVKFRMRRAADSEDVFDFNIILSPFDVWTGTIRGDDSAMEVATEDKTCTAPVFESGGTIAPLKAENLDGAQEGYIEIIGMGQADSDQPISKAALHVNGTPVDCNEVRSNFFVEAIIDNETTVGGDGTSTYESLIDALRVSYFIRDNNSGIEFGNAAIHTDDLLDEAAMTHQQFGLESFGTEGDAALYGWDFPDARGNSSLVDDRSGFVRLRNYIGISEIFNDWSYNPATGAATDWVVTIPGQYAMVDYYAQDIPGATFDYREIPVVATFTLVDREEGQGIPGGLNFSPSPAPDAALLPYEVNVITWGTGPDVLGSDFTLNVRPADAGIDGPAGWALLAVEGTPKQVVSGPDAGDAVPFAWCDVAAGPDNGGGTTASEDGFCDMYEIAGSAPSLPVMGFAAWERTFDDPNKNYGRIIEHGFTESD